MNRSPVLALIPLALAFSLSVVAAEEAPKMSPEEQAMMEAFVKAGTPGAQHARMAKAAGSYTITVKSWQQRSELTKPISQSTSALAAGSTLASGCGHFAVISG